jgi:hypothetical protein
MNELIPQEDIDAEYRTDPEYARAEFGAEFRQDLQTFILRSAVEACVIQGRYELPPQPDISYAAFVDISGGRRDSTCLCIPHKSSNGRLVEDLIREVEARPTLNPIAAAREFAAIIKSYGVNVVTGDNYAASLNTSVWNECGLHYERAELVKSDLFLELLHKVNSGTVAFLDDPRCTNQLCALVRKTSSGGKDRIVKEEGQGFYDDRINAVAGALIYADLKAAYASSLSGLLGPNHQPVEIRQDGRYGQIFASCAADETGRIAAVYIAWRGCELILADFDVRPFLEFDADAAQARIREIFSAIPRNKDPRTGMYASAARSRFSPGGCSAARACPCPALSRFRS